MSKPESNEPECPVTIAELADEIYHCGQYLKKQFSAKELREHPSERAGTDCRLQLHDGSWSFHSGSSDYDQDHRGSWGTGFVPRGCTRAESVVIARELIDEAMQDYEPEEGE